MITILGAGGAISNELVTALAGRSEPIRLVSRNPRMVPGATETVATDISRLDDTVKAVSGSRIVFLVAGLKYDINIWRKLWPPMMRNTIEVSKRARAKLVFFDNVYMYGKVNGPMTEEMPFRPSSQKGELRAQIATMLLDEIKAGTLTAMIARAPDFYGPQAPTGILNVLVLDNFARRRTANWLVRDSVKHSFSFTPDAARSLAMLTENETAWNQTWHVPAAPDPPTGREFIELAAREFGIKPKYRVLAPWMVRVGGLFDTTIGNLHEMLYQYQSDYIFDSTKFNKAFNFQPTSYVEGIRRSIQPYRQSRTAVA
jgi:nucleoside-diphosphate-sugar epimerase